jgi:mannose-1-phosphate guanylyltransferase
VTSSGAASPYVVILAGGDGVRLRPLTRRISGDARPKQYCPLYEGETLLERTRARAALVADPERHLVVVTRPHEPYYRYLLDEMAADRVVVQPDNRGTAPGILYPLVRVAARGENAPVVVLPSDHHVADDVALAGHLRAAVEAVSRRPGIVVLVGMQARAPETDYGWIEPHETPLPDDGAALFPIRRFWEKPGASLARRLMGRGCLWNSFMMVGTVRAFFALVRDTTPFLVTGFTHVRAARTPEDEAARAERLYAGLPSVSFSDAVLTQSTHRLATLPVKDVGWSDWGHPARVIATLRGARARPAWLSRIDLEPAV